MQIFLKTEDEINLMRKANQLVGATLAELGKHIKPGVTTLHLDRVAEEFIRDHGAIPTFKNFPTPYGEPFPASICTSINDVVVHGIPSEKDVLKDGDIISIDCGTLLEGFNGDSCYTFAVGEITSDVQQLLKVTKESLYLGIEQAVAGKPLYAFISCVLFAVSAMLTLVVAGQLKGAADILHMAVYVIAVTLFAWLVAIPVRRANAMISIIPVLLIACLILCPVFINITAYVPFAKYIRALLLPWYMLK